MSFSSSKSCSDAGFIARIQRGDHRANSDLVKIQQLLDGAPAALAEYFGKIWISMGLHGPLGNSEERLAGGILVTARGLPNRVKAKSKADPPLTESQPLWFTAKSAESKSAHSDPLTRNLYLRNLY